MMGNWKCGQCGKCCKFIVLNISGMSEDHKIWLSHHEKCTVEGETLTIKVKCKHLKRRNRKYYCDIYINRPEICKKAGEEECKLTRYIYDKS